MVVKKVYDHAIVGETVVAKDGKSLWTDVSMDKRELTIYWKLPIPVPRTDLDLNIFSALYANVASYMAERVDYHFALDPALFAVVNILRHHEEGMVRYCFQRPEYGKQYGGDCSITPHSDAEDLAELCIAYTNFEAWPSSALLCMSCGKDSYLSYELLRQGTTSNFGLVGVEFNGRDYLREEYRRWNPSESAMLIDTNVVDFFQWAPNIYDPGFMSISYCLIVCGLVARAQGRRFVIVSNEYDRTEIPKENVDWAPKPNLFFGAHYDQTNHFLNVMQKHILSRIGVQVVNLLGNLSELGVQRILTRISALWKHQLSCNVTPAINCKVCAKCKRVGLMMQAVGVDPHEANFGYYVEALNMKPRELFGESSDVTDLYALRYLLLGQELGLGEGAFRLRGDALHPLILPPPICHILEDELKLWRGELRI